MTNQKSKIKKISTIIISSLFLSLCIFSGWIAAKPDRDQGPVAVKLGEALEIGKDTFVFASIADVCEDKDGNFYIVDRLERKIWKFSRTGEELLTFGQAGRGPGDFSSPGRIAVTASGLLAVSEDMYDISLHETGGGFVERIHLSGKLGPGYIGEDRFYAWAWRPDSQEQVIVNRQNQVQTALYSVPMNAFSVSAPDESGRAVMFNYGPDTYAPALAFDHSSPLSAAAVSSRYEITLLDEQGQVVKTLCRDIEPPALSKAEINYFKQDIRKRAQRRGWPDGVVKDLQKLIPKHKMFFNRILLSGKHLFVFRIPDDITRPNTPVTADIFKTDGEFLGSSQLPETPIHISADYMYFVRTSPDDNVYFVQRSYVLKKTNTQPN
jgi:hypothetical protein